MSTQNNDVLGYTACEAGKRASVHQTKRGKGRYLYTRCDCCGCDQRNGAAVQTRLYNTTQWLGEPPEAPPNLILTTENEPKTTEKKAVVEPVVEPKKDDWIPPVELIGEPEKEPKGNGLGVVAAIGGCLAFIGFLLSRAKG